MLSAKLLGSELVEEKLGSWPTFHDAEILTMVLDRSGPTLLVRILIGVPIRPPETWTPEAVEAWTHFEVNLRFNDIDSLELSSVVTSKLAIEGHLKTGHRAAART
jgi:Immunity protein 50